MTPSTFTLSAACTLTSGRADSLYCYSAQRGLNSAQLSSLLEHLARSPGDTRAQPCRDPFTLTLTMAALATFDVSSLVRGDSLSEPQLITTMSRELGGGTRKWEQGALLAILQLAWAMTLGGLRVSGMGVGSAAQHIEEDELFIYLALQGKAFHPLPTLFLASPAYVKEE